MHIHMNGFHTLSAIKMKCLISPQLSIIPRNTLSKESNTGWSMPVIQEHIAITNNIIL